MPGRETEFRTGFAQALRYAKALNYPSIHAMAGLLAEGVSADEADATLVSNLHWAAAQAGKVGLIAIVKKELQLEASLYTFLQILSVSFFEKTSISCVLQSDAYTSEEAGSAKQLNLFTF